MSSQTPIAEDRNSELAPVYKSAITVLTLGFRTGAVLLMIGLVISLIKQEALNERVNPFREVVPALFDGKASAIIDLAILALMATPLLTVIVVAAGFFRAGDRRYGFLSLVVLGVLGVGVILALVR